MAWLMIRLGSCGHPLSRYNPGPDCHACQQAAAHRRFTAGERRAAILHRLASEAVTNEMVQEQFGVSDRVARDDLRKLRDAGHIEVVGRGRVARYRLVKDQAA